MCYLVNVCKVGDKGQQSVDTCQFLNRTKLGYFCKKLTLEGKRNHTNSLLGDNCVGIHESVNIQGDFNPKQL